VSRSPLVTPTWLAERLGEPSVVVVDTRWYLKNKKGIDAYRAGHIPSAVFADVDGELSALPGPGRPGRHPLPDADSFATLLARLGVTPDSTVVAYDDSGGSTAARLWWLLRYFGHDIGKVLDGGIQAWIGEGRPVDTELTARTPAARIRLTPHSEMVIDKERVKRLVERGEGLLLDARASERYEGITEPVDARPGHIPGAKSAPFNTNLRTPGGTFRPAEELASHYASLGVGAKQPVVAYCGSSVTACHDLLALSLAGRDDALLYEGSWSEWAADLALAVGLGKV
jgi:thiosulfate/3-mercaptopyruvate sulfurtransferase